MSGFGGATTAVVIGVKAETLLVDFHVLDGFGL